MLKLLKTLKIAKKFNLNWVDSTHEISVKHFNSWIHWLWLKKIGFVLNWCSSDIQSLLCQQQANTVLFLITLALCYSTPHKKVKTSIFHLPLCAPHVEQSIHGCFFCLMRSQRWHTKPLFSIMPLWVPTRSASLPVCCLALSTLAPPSTWASRFPLSLFHYQYNSLSQPIKLTNRLSRVM